MLSYWNVLLPFLLVMSWPLIMILMPFVSKKISPGLRFKLSVIILLIIWSFLSLFLYSKTPEFSIWQSAAGFLFILAVLLFAFMIWSVMCWGFTISMLLWLSKIGKAITLSEWIALYTNEDGIRGMTCNRAQILSWYRLGILNHDEVTLTARGHFLARLAQQICYYLGVKK